MKKFVLIMGLCIVGMAVNAQSLQSRYHKTLDTLTTGSKSMTSVNLPGVAETVTVTTANTVLTGTMTGTARLFGSVDGVKYQRIRSTTLQGGQIDSLNLDAAHPNYAWVVAHSPFQYYQVQTTQATGTFTVQGKVVKH